MIDQKPLKTDFPYKYFMLLHSNFFDSFQKISQNHQIICKYLLEEMSKNNNEENIKKIQTKILTTTESLKTIVEFDLRFYYFQYLKFIFCLSEPLTTSQLRKNFQNKLFPCYLFTLLFKKKEIIHLNIDFFDRKITLLNKDKKIEIINQEKIIEVSTKFNNSIIITLNEKMPGSDKNKEIEIFPEFFQQVDLIYKIINFFIKCNLTENKNENDEFGLSLLDDDTYLPKGILLKDHILKEHQNKLLSKDKRYAVLGSSLIIIFKDKSMKEIRNVIPLLPFAAQLISDDKELTITLKFFNRDQSLTFFDEDTYFVWKNTLKDIFNKKKVEKIEGITLYQIKAQKLNNGIMNLINDEIKDIQEKIKENNEDLGNIKKIITEDRNNMNDVIIFSSRSESVSSSYK